MKAAAAVLVLLFATCDGFLPGNLSMSVSNPQTRGSFASSIGAAAAAVVLGGAAMVPQEAEASVGSQLGNRKMNEKENLATAGLEAKFASNPDFPQPTPPKQPKQVVEAVKAPAKAAAKAGKQAAATTAAAAPPAQPVERNASKKREAMLACKSKKTYKGGERGCVADVLNGDYSVLDM